MISKASLKATTLDPKVNSKNMGLIINEIIDHQSNGISLGIRQMRFERIADFMYLGVEVDTTSGRHE